MRQRNYKYCIFHVLAFLGGVWLCASGGCSDDPENAASKRVREKTAQAVEGAVKDKDYAAAQQKVASAVAQDSSKAGRLSKDSAVLAGGNLALAHGRRMQAALDLKTMPLRQAVTALEKLLRYSEELLLEKERLEGLLAGSQQEKTELQQSLNGDAQQTGLNKQLEDIGAEANQLLSQKEQEQAQKDKTQATLDEYQSRADALMRKAELAEGDEKLKLQKEAFAILQESRQYYIQAQESENKIAALDGQLKLVQRRLEGVQQSVKNTQERIDAIDNSQTLLLFKQQAQAIDQTLSVNQQQLAAQMDAIKNGLDGYRKESEDVCNVFEAAAAEFERVGSRDTGFTAGLQQAQSCHYAALTCSAWINVLMNTSERLQDLFETIQPELAALLRDKLPAADSQTMQSKVMELFDKAMDAYQQAFDAAGSVGQEAQCSVLKSTLLAVDSKMKLAERLGLSEISAQAGQKREELMQQGQTYGDCFTQSETRKLLESGINYTPSLPINMDVLAEDLEKRFTAWKRLPVVEQEAAVAANLTEIDELIGRYGETLAQKLEPIKQEMLAAQQRGFKEITPEAGAVPGGMGEPNAFY